jgi:pyruvate/2-oxoglutarate dehydrogenase complex dihydrolipoamide dehydrogenase (E3) component
MAPNVTARRLARPGGGYPDAVTDQPPFAERARVDVAVIGSGSAGTSLAHLLSDGGMEVAVAEVERVGGECPFVACMPSKTLLHDAAAGIRWHDAVRHRDDVIDHLDDSRHARSLEAAGVMLLRGRAEIVDERTLQVDGTTVDADHLVIATGSAPIVPSIDGLASLEDRYWTSRDALLTDELPARVTIVGGGVVGCELAHLFAGFGSEVHVLDSAERAFPELLPEVGELVDDHLRGAGVRVCRGVEVARVEQRGGNVLISLDNEASLATDRLIGAVGGRPRLDGFGIERLRLDPSRPLPVGDDGRVDCPGSVWAIGDVAGTDRYTHVANHHARVVADQLVGERQRRFGDVVVPACVFTTPPVMVVGPTFGDLEGDDDVVWVRAELSRVARWSTDNPATGLMALAVRRSDRCVVAAHGVGERFDELAAAVVTAVDGAIPVDLLARSLRPFPTVSELLGLLYSDAVEALSGN